MSKSRTYILQPAGLLDVCDKRVTKHTGAEVRKIQPHGCPKNGTMRQAYVERIDTGEFIGLVNLASLQEKGAHTTGKDWCDNIERKHGS